MRDAEQAKPKNIKKDVDKRNQKSYNIDSSKESNKRGGKMYKWEAVQNKLDRCEVATSTRAQELAELLMDLSEKLIDLDVSGNYEGIRALIEKANEDLDYAFGAYIEDDDARQEAEIEAANLSDAEEWEEVKGA